MSRLRALLPSPVAQPRDKVLSPVSTGPVSLRQASSAELVGKSPRRTRRAKRQIRPVRVMKGSVGELSVPHYSGGRWSTTVGLHCSLCRCK